MNLYFAHITNNNENSMCIRVQTPNLPESALLEDGVLKETILSDEVIRVGFIRYTWCPPQRRLGSETREHRHREKEGGFLKTKAAVRNPASRAVSRHVHFYCVGALFPGTVLPHPTKPVRGNIADIEVKCVSIC